MLNTKVNPWPSFTIEESNKIKKILLSNKVNYWTGNECRQFELEFAKFADAKFAISLANGTLALDLALKALSIEKGDEVLVTPRSYIASASSIVNCGAKPVFIDVCRDSQNINLENIEKFINKKTKAIICVHLAGWPCDMKKIKKIAKKFNLFVIEDCAQAHGAKWHGKSVGSYGDIGCWSFCQDKIITTGGEGGMITTNSQKLWKKMWEFKDHGKSYDAIYKKKHPTGFRWLHNSFGTNWRMNEIQAGIGRIQLKKMKRWTNLRNKNANLILRSCKKFKLFRVPEFPDKNHTHAYYKCYVFVNTELLRKDWNRDKIMDKINSLGIPCTVGSCPEIYLEKAFIDKKLMPKKRLSVAKELGETSLCFLVHPTLSSKNLDKTITIISKVAEMASK
tara:strand:+ start:12494 stop:13672 length:1179 start_codon:yes stop_codon:yes gene_type:complete